eukprot:GHVU01020151.1.p1 GENE.GHVU01020151.1~~GHVU01020151.1.p1  ORF type:complete len:141 (-),score=2.77 GHVU01020151.1:545-967(-)
MLTSAMPARRAWGRYHMEPPPAQLRPFDLELLAPTALLLLPLFHSLLHTPVGLRVPLLPLLPGSCPYCCHHRMTYRGCITEDRFVAGKSPCPSVRLGPVASIGLVVPHLLPARRTKTAQPHRMGAGGRNRRRGSCSHDYP